jgi:hypothetical protein
MGDWYIVMKLFTNANGKLDWLPIANVTVLVVMFAALAALIIMVSIA